MRAEQLRRALTWLPENEQSHAPSMPLQLFLGFSLFVVYLHRQTHAGGPVTTLYFISDCVSLLVLLPDILETNDRKLQKEKQKLDKTG